MRDQEPWFERGAMTELTSDDRLLYTRLRLRRDVHLRIDSQGALRLWVPTHRLSKVLGVSEVEVIQRLAPGASPAEVARDGDFEESEVLACVRVLLEADIVEVERAVSAIERP